MTINQLRYFCVLAHIEHYGKAAEELYIAQPSLSRAISLLEEELGVELFSKQGRNVTLTHAGRVFLEYVEQSLSILELGVGAMQKFSNHTEILSVGCITPFLGRNSFHSYLLDAFSLNRSQLDISVSQTENLLNDLRKHRYDLVFCSYSSMAQDINFIPILELPYVVAMAKDDELAKYDSIFMEQLRNRAMVFNAEPIYSSFIQRIFDYYHITPIVKGSSNEDSVLLRMVADKVGLLISTDHIQMHTDETVLKPLNQNKFHRYVYLAYLPNSNHSNSAQQIIDYAKKHTIEEKGLQPKVIDRYKNLQENS